MDVTTPATGGPPRDNEPDSRVSLRHILAADPDMEDAKPTPSQRDTPGPEDQSNAQDASPTKSGDADSKPYYTSTTTTTRRNANGSVSSVYSGNKIRHLKKDDGIPLWRKDIQYDFLRHVFEDPNRVFHKFSDGPGGDTYTFADIYLDAMANSSKCSKILKDKLLTERPAAINMAMVCLLVNVGRMNTTLNFFPEMRAQLRTYHSIPSLQAHQDPNAYKQLQDAPRLKSILKGATEDTEQPSTVEDIKRHPVPRTNPVNLIFVLSQYAPKISELHFFPPRDFFDLVMRPNLSSRSRATAFLWLMWWYLESNFTKEDALNNPYGPGQYGPPDDPATADMPIKCPPFEFLTPEMEALENVDTPDELNFGEIKRKERQAILENDMSPVVTGPKRSNKKGFQQNPVFSVLADDGASTPGRDRQSPSHGKTTPLSDISPHNERTPRTNIGSTRGRSKLARSIMERDYPSDTDRTRSASPPGSVYGKKGTPNMRINTLLNEDGPSSTPAPKGPGRGNWSRSRVSGVGGRGFKAKLDPHGTPQDGQSPAANGPPVSNYSGPHGFYLPLNGSDPSHKRTRPLTTHQQAVEQFRRRRVEVILDRGLRVEYKRAAKRRRANSSFMRSWVRCKGITDGYDTDEESNIQALQQADIEVGAKAPPPMFAGLLPLDYGGEVNDYGEEAYHRAKMLSRTLRRLERWESGREVVRGRKRSVEDEVEQKSESAGWALRNGDAAATRNGNGNGAGNGVPAAGPGRNGVAREQEEEKEDEDEEMQDVGDEDDDDDEQYTLPPLSSVV